MHISWGILRSACSFKLKSYGSYIGFNTSFDNCPLFPHSYNGIFIPDDAHIGKNCVIYQQVTIGSTYLENMDNAEGLENISFKFGPLTIDDNCYIGVGAKIIGKVTIGNNVKIVVGAITVDDIPDNCSVVSPKARIVKMNNPDINV